MNHLLLKSRLTAMNFLEFAVWGAYLTSLGTYLAGIGMVPYIKYFYMVQGIVIVTAVALDIRKYIAKK